MNPATVSTERRWRCWMPGKTRGLADALAARRGCTVPQLLTDLLIEETAIQAGIDDEVNASSAAPGVELGQGETTPPAPTTVRVLAPAPCGWSCNQGDEACWDTDGSARWLLDAEDGTACCDAHIPDGWVRPDEVPALPPIGGVS